MCRDGVGMCRDGVGSMYGVGVCREMVLVICVVWCVHTKRQCNTIVMYVVQCTMHGIFTNWYQMVSTKQLDEVEQSIYPTDMPIQLCNGVSNTAMQWYL